MDERVEIEVKGWYRYPSATGLTQTGPYDELVQLPIKELDIDKLIYKFIVHRRLTQAEQWAIGIDIVRIGPRSCRKRLMIKRFPESTSDEWWAIHDMFEELNMQLERTPWANPRAIFFNSFETLQKYIVVKGQLHSQDREKHS